MGALVFIIKAFGGTFIEALLRHVFGLLQEYADDAAREQLGAERSAKEATEAAVAKKAEVDAETRRDTTIDEVIGDLEAGRF